MNGGPLPQGPERDDRTEMTSLTVPQDLGEITAIQDLL